MNRTALRERRDICAGYAGVDIVRDISLEVRAGEVVALLGPNGAGKTTTLLTLAGGSGRFAGKYASRAPARPGLCIPARAKGWLS